jgi:hypothetical protein
MSSELSCRLSYSCLNRISNELIRYYESLVSRRRASHSEENPHLSECIAEIREVWETRVILRDLRNRAGVATCSWEVDCLEAPISPCMRGDRKPQLVKDGSGCRSIWSFGSFLAMCRRSP